MRGRLRLGVVAIVFCTTTIVSGRSVSFYSQVDAATGSIQDHFPDVPDDFCHEAAFGRLKRAGVRFPDPFPSRLSISFGPPDRRRLGEAVASAADDFATQVLADSPSALKSEFTPIVPILRELLLNYRKEIDASGRSTRVLLTTLSAAESKLHGGAFDVPHDHDVYRQLSRAKRSGLLVGDLGGHRWSITRAQIALALTKIAEEIEGHMNEVQVAAREISLLSPDDPNAHGMQKALATKVADLQIDARPLVPGLVGAIDAFADSFPRIGEDGKAVRRRLRDSMAKLDSLSVPKVGVALKPFPDVPASHWAAEAAHRLRREGILRGYPWGRFGS